MFKQKTLKILALTSFLSITTAHANEPTTEPILRIETGMHTAQIKRIGVDAAERFLSRSQTPFGNAFLDALRRTT
ncbi:MAG: hypothetical protein KAI83_09425 [Thiomargarita sp.]|nr:hypothetical protein [Thiomargarita sp.]